MKRFLEAGQIVGTHGINGEIRVNPWCDTPEILSGIKDLYFENGEKVAKIKSRPHKNVVLMIIDGVNSIEEAEKLKGTVLYLNREDVNLDGDSFFIQDIVGMQVVDIDSGEIYGEVFKVNNLGASDLYHIKTPKGDVLIPAIPDIIMERDFDNKLIKIKVMPGLFED